MRTILLFANSDWYLYNFRLPLARAIRESGAHVLLAAPPGPYSGELTEAGFEVISAPMNRRSMNPIAELTTLWWLANFLDKHHVDLVHGFTLKSAIYAGLAVRLRSRGSTAVLAIAGLGFVFSSDSKKANILRPLVKSLLKLACGGERQRVIVQNRDDQSVLSQFCGIEKVKLIKGSGVNGTKFKLAERQKDSPFTVLFAARLLRSKGIFVFLEAAKQIKEMGFDINFLVAGTPDPDNPDSCSPQELITWKAVGCANFLGHVDQMSELLAGSHAVVLPTTYGEGVPRILVEAAFSGCALIASDTAGCRELVLHQQTGLLVDPGSSTEVVDAILKIYQNPPFLNKISRSAREFAEKEFSEQRVIEETLQVYEEIFSSSLKNGY